MWCHGDEKIVANVLDKAAASIVTFLYLKDGDVKFVQNTG